MKNNTAKKRTNSQASFAKQATDWLAEKFDTTKAIKERREKTDKKGKEIGK